MKFKDLVLSDASTEAKVAALAVLLDKELLKLAETVFNVQKIEGPKGEQGLQGPKGEQGDRGFDGVNGKDGNDGQDGRDGEEGEQGVGVQDAHVDFDGSLVITLTDGREINAGEVVPLDVAEKIKIIGNGGGTSQGVLDAIAAIQATIATYGTMAFQNKTSVDIEGGTIDSTVIGSTTPAAGTFTTLIGGKDQANYGQITGGATTKAVEFVTLGTDVNIAAVIKSKGTGAIDLAAGSKGVNISNGGTVTAITRTSTGTGYTSVPSLAISAPTTAGGVQATASPYMAGQTVAVSAGGTGYTVGDTLTVTGGAFITAAQLRVDAVSAGVVTATSFVNTAGVYSALPTNPVSVTGGTGTGATFNITAWFVASTAPNITNAGSGYVEQPTVSFSGGGGSGAAAYATVGSGTTVKSVGSTMSFSTAGGEQFRVIDNAGATQYIAAVGSSTGNVSFNFSGSGTGGFSYVANSGSHRFWSSGANEQFRINHTASAVNYVQVTGAATGGTPVISMQGSDANIGVVYRSKGTGVHIFQNSSGNWLLRVGNPTGTLVNYPLTFASVSGSPSGLQVEGTDTNIDLALTPKGTGNVRFGTYTASMALTIQGYIEIKDSGGTVRKLAVIA
jgi:hypothetical protein